MDPLSITTVITGIGSLLLDGVKELREALAQKKAEAPGLIEVGSLIELYGIVTKLSGLSTKLASIAEKKANEITKADKALFHHFFDELRRLGDTLASLNFSLVEIYYPAITQSLRETVYLDNIIVDTFLDTPGASRVRKLFMLTYGIKERRIQAIVDTFDKLDKTNALWRRRNITNLEYDELRKKFTAAKLRKTFATLYKLLEETRSQLGEIVKDNWNFKELAQRKQM